MSLVILDGKLAELRTRLAQNSSLNDRRQSHCLWCGRPVTIGECAIKEFVFCDTACQERLWRLDDTLALRLKDRGALGLIFPPPHTFSCPVIQRPSDTPVTFNLGEQTRTLAQKRHILFTDARLQLAVQRLLPGERVAREMHPTQDQFLRVEQGQVVIVFGSGERLQLTADATDTAIICAGTWHEIVNRSSSVTARFYTVYGPPAHTIEEQRADDRQASGVYSNSAM